ncbi:MAG TPA: tetratricopeptide repeat protein [Armatimonadota bacterium]|nr:tetratricopeptide repeat protein [Armatimonadota bacterium]
MRRVVVQAVVLGVTGVALLAGFGWWLSPAGVRYRYAHSDLVTLRRIAAREPRNQRAWRELGLRLARDGDGAMAEPALRQAYALDAGDAEVATGLGEILVSRGERSQAFQVLRAAVGQHPEFPPARMALGRLYRRRGAYHRAAEQFEAVATTRKDYPDAWYELAVCYLQMQQVAKASDAIGRALHESPREPSYLALQAATQAAVGQIDPAIASLSEAARLAPKDARIQASLATMLLTHQRGAQDLVLADRSITSLENARPDHPLLPYLRGRRALAAQDWSTAAEHLERARQSTPDQDEVYYALSQAYRRLGRAAESDRTLQEYRRRQAVRREMDELRIHLAVSADPVPLYEKLADLQMRLGDAAGAVGSCESALQLAPQNERIRRRLAELRGVSPAEKVP